MLGNLVVSPRKPMAGNEPTTNNSSTITNSCETHIIYGTKQPTSAENMYIYIYIYVYIYIILYYIILYYIISWLLYLYLFCNYRLR